MLYIFTQSNHNMLYLFFIKFLIVISVFFLSAIIVLLSNKNYLGSFLKNFCYSNTLSEIFVSTIIVSGVLMLLLNISFVLINYFITLANSALPQLDHLTCTVLDKNSVAQDPIRYWPSGIAQNWGIIGSALAVYRFTGGSHRIRATAALSTMAITIPINVWFHAVENPHGFNTLVYSWITYKQTGVWPRSIPTNITSDSLETVVRANTTAEAEAVANTLNNTTTNNFLPTGGNNILDNLSLDNIIQYFIGYFRPIGVEGHLDDLIGQQLLIHFLLLSVVVGLIFLIIIYFITLTMYINRDFITKKFNNKFIRLYIKYQFFLSKISLIVLPLFIFLGLMTLIQSSYYMITHPVPYEILDVNLHVYVDSK